MASAYGSWVATDDFRAKVDATYSATATSATVTVKVYVESQYGSDSGSTTATAKCGASTSSSSGLSIPQGTTTLLYTKTFNVTLTHSTQSVTCQGIVRCDNSTYGGASSTASVTLTLPTKANYAVSYNANSGTGAPASQTKWHNESLTLSGTAPTRSGYTFRQWHATGGVDAWFDPGDTYTANASSTLYAAWDQNQWTVSYNANGGSGSVASQTKVHGTNLTLRSNSFTRTGYDFTGWNTKADGTGTSYAAGGTYSADAAATMYAQWSLKTYTVSYNANGGSGTMSSQSKNYGQPVALRSNSFTRSATSTAYTVTYDSHGGSSAQAGTSTKTTSYTFNKWNTKADGTGATYSAGASYTANASVTMYAQWNSSSSTSSVTLPTVTRAGYTLKGWYTASSGGTKVGNAGASYTPTASVTLHAQWAAVTYTVSYNANGGSGAPASQTKSYGTNITLSSTEPTKAGSTFIGWNTSADGSGTHYNKGATYSANSSVTLYAQWIGASVTSANPKRTNDSTGTVTARWTASSTVSGTVAITASSTATGVTVTVSGTTTGSTSLGSDASGTVTVTVSGIATGSDVAPVTIAATITTSYQSKTHSGTRAATIPKAFRLLDAFRGGTGLAIGTIATLANTFEVGLVTIFDKAVTMVVPLAVTSGGTGVNDHGAIVQTSIEAAVSVAHVTTTAVGNVQLSQGKWLISYCAEFADNSSGFRKAVMSTANGGGQGAAWVRLTGSSTNAVNGDATILQGSFERTVGSGGETLYLNCYQSSGSSLGVTGSIQAVKIG